MHTTLIIDDDVLHAARDLARRSGSSVGAVLSEPARKGLNGPPADAAAKGDGFCGFQPLPKRGRPVTNELIDRLREDGPYCPP